MTYDPAKHHRRSIRLKGYDYSQPGAYFVTIVTQRRECQFGAIVDGEMQLNDAGRMVARWWAELGNKYPRVIPDVCVVMPNHFHGMVIITDGRGAHADDRGAHADDRGAYADKRGAHTDKRGAHVGAPLQPTGMGDDVGTDLRVCPNAGAHAGAPLPEIVQWFKTMTTNEYIRGVKTLGWTPFPGKLWQRNYYEHIIRNNASLNRIRQYIIDNPARWDDDDENPAKAAR